MIQIAVLLMLLLLAGVVLAGSIIYRVREIREDEAVWDAVIDRVCGSGS